MSELRMCALRDGDSTRWLIDIEEVASVEVFDDFSMRIVSPYGFVIALVDFGTREKNRTAYDTLLHWTKHFKDDDRISRVVHSMESPPRPKRERLRC